MDVQTPSNQERFDQDVVIINEHLVLNTSLKFNMVTDFMEPYAITIKVMGECPFILVHTPVNYDTKRHRLVVSSDAYNDRTWSEESVLDTLHVPMRKFPLCRLPANPVFNNVWTVFSFAYY